MTRDIIWLASNNGGGKRCFLSFFSIVPETTHASNCRVGKQKSIYFALSKLCNNRVKKTEPLQWNTKGTEKSWIGPAGPVTAYASRVSGTQRQQSSGQVTLFSCYFGKGWQVLTKKTNFLWKQVSSSTRSAKSCSKLPKFMTRENNFLPFLPIFNWTKLGHNQWIQILSNLASFGLKMAVNPKRAMKSLYLTLKPMSSCNLGHRVLQGCRWETLRAINNAPCMHQCLQRAPPRAPHHHHPTLR